MDGAILILIFAFSGALRIRCHGTATERNIRSLMQLTPDQARVMVQGQERMVATQQLRVGDRILIKPGELIPTDGLIQGGRSTVKPELRLRGESIPIEKKLRGMRYLPAPSTGSGALTVELHKPPESSLIQAGDSPGGAGQKRQPAAFPSNFWNDLSGAMPG